MSFKFEVGQELYTKAGNFVEIIKIDCANPDYPILGEVQGYDRETTLVNYTLDGQFLLDKKTIMDLDLS